MGAGPAGARAGGRCVVRGRRRPRRRALARPVDPVAPGPAPAGRAAGVAREPAAGRVGELTGTGGEGPHVSDDPNLSELTDGDKLPPEYPPDEPAGLAED